jgi:hypothetical protein
VTVVYSLFSAIRPNEVKPVQRKLFFIPFSVASLAELDRTTAEVIY